MATETAPDARQVLHGTDLVSFSHLVERRLSLKATMKELEEEVKGIDESLTALLTDNDAPKLQYGPNTIQLVAGSRSSLQKDKLIEAGVAPAILERCTKTTVFSYILIK